MRWYVSFPWKVGKRGVFSGSLREESAWKSPKKPLSGENASKRKKKLTIPSMAVPLNSVVNVTSSCSVAGDFERNTVLRICFVLMPSRVLWKYSIGCRDQTTEYFQRTRDGINNAAFLFLRYNTAKGWCFSGRMRKEMNEQVNGKITTAPTPQRPTANDPKAWKAYWEAHGNSGELNRK